MGLTDFLFGSKDAPQSLWGDLDRGDEYNVTFPVRALASKYEDIAKPLTALDEMMAGGPRVAFCSTTGIIPERVEIDHSWRGWLAMNAEQLTHHTCVIGAPGRGKTSLILNPIVMQVLDRFKGSSIFSICIKDTAVSEFEAMLRRFPDRTHAIAAPGASKWNLIEGLSPSEAAEACSDVFSGKSDTSQHFASLARTRLEHALNLIQLCELPYNLHTAMQFCFDKAYEKWCLELADACASEMQRDSIDWQTLQESIFFARITFGQMDPRSLGDVENTLLRSLKWASTPALRNTFAAESGGLDIDAMISNGGSIACHVPPLYGDHASILYAIIKRRFAAAVTRRDMLKRDSLILAVFDEAATYLSASDATFLQLVRQYNCAAVISCNVFSAIVSAFDDPNTALTIIDNCSTQIYFDVDHASLQQIQSRTGKVRIMTKGKTAGTGGSRSTGAWGQNQGGGSNDNTGSSETETFIDLIDGSVFLNLPEGCALVAGYFPGIGRFVDVCMFGHVFIDIKTGAINADYPSHVPWFPPKSLDPHGKIARNIDKMLASQIAAQRAGR
jgi:hypothetical protein